MEPTSESIQATLHVGDGAGVLRFSRAKMVQGLFWVYMLSLAFDFRSDQVGGTWVQYAFCCIGLVASMLVLFVKPLRLQIHGIRWIVVLFGSFLVLSTFSGVLYGAEFGNGARVALPFVFFFISVLMVDALWSCAVNVTWVLGVMTVVAFISTGWTAFQALFIHRIPMDEMRYQILSPTIPYLFAYGLVGVTMRTSHRTYPGLAMVLVLALALISVTRSMVLLVGCGVMALALTLWFAGMLRQIPLLRPKKLVYLGPICGLLVVGGIASAYYLRPDLLEQWVGRLFWRDSVATGQDPTAMTRIAEWQGIWNSIEKAHGALLWGKGFGGTYLWDGDYREFLLPYAGAEVFDVAQWSPPHSMWVQLGFCGGAFGIVLVGFVFFIVARRVLAACRDAKQRREREIYQLILAVTACACFLSQSFTSSPLGTRLSGMFLGLCTAIVVLFPNPRGLDSTNSQSVKPAARTGPDIHSKHSHSA